MPVLTLPLGNAVSYRGMVGTDEDLLTNRKKLQSGEAIDEIMASCVESMGEVGLDGEYTVGKEVVQVADVLRLKTPDRVALLMAIRRESFGDEMDVEIQCECGRKNDSTVDLSCLVEKPLPEEYNEDFGFEVKLSTGVTVQFDYMNGNRERMLSKQTDNLLTMGMLARLGSVEGVDSGNRKTWLLKLPVRLRNELRARMSEADCGVVTSAVTECSSCGSELRFEVQGQPGFFFPAM